ncbi:MAG TPA: glycosyl hydrolase family 28-related protein [Verrucomicrobiae bacterium]|nr:glycosyl hydrolase family 28-related protein [Verrucomicrobiae bacterium]
MPGSLGSFLGSACALILSFALPAQGQEWLIAMGDGSSSCYRGTTVPNPDPNGHYWNAVDSAHSFPNLTNINGQATSIAMVFDYSSGNDSYNGPAGITFNPNDVVVNTAALGDLGYNYGVYHYYVNTDFEIQGLNPSLRYNLTFFGSHAYSTDTATTYSIYPNSAYTNAISSVYLNIQYPSTSWVCNTNQVATLTNVSPQPNGTIYIGFVGAQGDSGYLNAMEIQVATTTTSNSTPLASGATVPWITYEAENMTNNGTVLGPSYSPNTVAAESSGRQCVQLGATGQFLQFTAQTNANAIVVRYSVPDTANGIGTNYTLSLYTNGTFAAKLPMTSMYSWLYGNYPFTNNPSSGSPRNFFDEVRTNGWTITAGEVIKLQVDTNDTASFYDIDLVDLENVPVPISQPNGSVSIKNYGAVGDGVSDDTSALQNCINANSSVWLPAGNYKITGSINLPSNKIIQGAGMWYTTLVGDPTLYANYSRRVTLNGAGNNIHVSDMAIVGKLNYRNDTEPNDGIGGSYGTSSTISNMWVEHTKTGAWLVNSQGLVVQNCRFRDTIADGINLCVGMRGTTVTNCTARGTGDDCFPIWPTTYTSQNFFPGFNVITHCTGQTPFLANGGAIYGGLSNTIQDCRFQDITYGCGILISTTFSVLTNTIVGAVVQRCDVLRSGGYDPGYQWRAAVQICLDTYANGASGVNLNNLNIVDSASDGMSVIGGNGTLSGALASYINIPDYGLGVGGRNGLWAQSGAVGSMTVSNSTITEYRDDSSTFTFNFVTSNVPITIRTSPSGLSFTADGTNYTGTQTFNWPYNTTHTIATTSPQSGGTGVQYIWDSWNDGGALSHTVTANTNFTYTVAFSTQYYLTMNAGAGGSVSPASGWYNIGTNVTITASVSNNYTFGGWTGSGSGSYSGSDNPASVTMNGPVSETANFAANIPVTVQAGLSGLSFTVDGTSYTNAQVFSWVAGSNHTISTTTPQSGGTGVQYVWNSWSDSGALSHVVSPTNGTTYTANFTTQYYLTMSASSGGTVTPSSAWNNSGAVVGIAANASGGYTFSGWTGGGADSYSGNNSSASVTMNEPIAETASFTAVPTRVISLSGYLGFGDVAIGSLANRTLTINNTGNSTLTVSSITHPDGFSGNWSGTIPGGGSTNLTVTFLPQVATNYGGNLAVNSDATSGVNTLAVWGIGAPTNGASPALAILSINLNADFSVTITYATTTGFPYHIESTTNLIAATWQIVPGSATNAPGTSVSFTDTNAPGNAQLFYRVGSP